MPKAKKKRRKRGSGPIINIKVSHRDRRQLNAAAKEFFNGNLSGWLRFAGKNFRPLKLPPL